MNPDKLREMRINSLAKDLGLASVDDMSLDEIWKLAEETGTLRDQVGPFDIAYEHFAKQSNAWGKLAFYRECEERKLDQLRENALKKLLPLLGRNLFTHTAESALAKACELEEMANDPKNKLFCPPNHAAVRKVREESDAYLALAAMFPPSVVK